MTHNADVTSRLPSRSARRWSLDLAVMAVAAISGVLLIVTLSRDPVPPPLAEAVDPLMPDLVMAPIQTVAAGLPTEDGRQPLGFSAMIANIGAGDFLAAGARSWPWTDDWSVVQRIQDGSGGYTEHPTTVGLAFGGDGHDHWHIRSVEAHRLEDIASGEILHETEKLGFCFYDTHALRHDLPGSPDEPAYFADACEAQISTGQLVGLSVGWGDLYPLGLPEQWFYIEDLPAGEYRLRQIADPDDQFLELDETNNETWVDFRLEWPGGLPRVTVIDRGPEN